MAFSRKAGDNEVIVIANFGKEPYTPVFNYPGNFTDAFTGEVVDQPRELNLAPGEFVVFTR